MEVTGDAKVALVVTGNGCRRGRDYAEQEARAPKRVVTSLMPTECGGVLPCKTDGAVDKARIFDVLREIKKVKATAPKKIGDILIASILDTGVNVVATADLK